MAEDSNDRKNSFYEEECKVRQLSTDDKLNMKNQQFSRSEMISDKK